MCHQNLNYDTCAMFDAGDCCDPRSGSDTQHSHAITFNNQCHLKGELWPHNITDYIGAFYNGSFEGLENQAPKVNARRWMRIPYKPYGQSILTYGSPMLSVYRQPQYSGNTRRGQENPMSRARSLALRRRILLVHSFAEPYMG